jgi:hypothetical protein
MSSDYDPAEFIDGDFQAQRSPFSAAAATQARRAPTREEVDSELAQTQQKLAAIMREKEEKERERASLEETRRRQIEFQTGREEMLQHLTRGLGLLGEAEFGARQEAEQMGKALGGLREALTKIEGLHEESWTKDTFTVELTRALTTVENARMEWNAARLKFPILSGQPLQSNPEAAATTASPTSLFATHSFGELCRLGFALTWPVAVAALVASGVIVFVLLRH